MIEIIPAVLEQSLEAIEEKLAPLRGLVREVQIDVCDGLLVSSKTWPFLGGAGFAELERIVSGEEGLPLWEDFDFQFDLMVREPLALAQQLISAGGSAIVLHADATGALAAAQALQDLRGGEFPISVGVALRCIDTPETLAAFERLYDFVQVMGITKVSFQQQPFDERAIKLLGQLRTQFPMLVLQIDGGVGFEHLSDAIVAGANRIIEGSAIFTDDNPRAALLELRDIAAENN